MNLDSALNTFQQYNLVLASGSPRRRQLLAAAGYDFKVIVPDDSVEKSVSDRLSPHQFVAEASYQKGRSVAENLKTEIVVAADTVAACNDQMLGKPKDRKHAEEILSQLSGEIHSVLTGTTLWNCDSGTHVTHVETTILQMKHLDHETLLQYLDSNDWIGKAGAFGYQDGIEWIQILSGLESNVVGLPIELLPDLIEQVT